MQQRRAAAHTANGQRSLRHIRMAPGHLGVSDKDAYVYQIKHITTGSRLRLRQAKCALSSALPRQGRTGTSYLEIVAGAGNTPPPPLLLLLNHCSLHSLERKRGTVQRQFELHDSGASGCHISTHARDTHLGCGMTQRPDQNVRWLGNAALKDSRRFAETVSTEWRHKFHIIPAIVADPRKLVTV